MEFQHLVLFFFVKTNNLSSSYSFEHGLLGEQFNIVGWHDAINN